MRPSHPRSFRDHATFLRQQFLQDGELPFTTVLTEDVLAQALATVGGWLDRIFSPLVTLWVFLGQVLSADHSCRAAVARLIAHRVAGGQSPCSARTGAYCSRCVPELGSPDPCPWSEAAAAHTLAAASFLSPR